MIYAIITTSLVENFFDIRKHQYINAININMQILNNIPNIKIIIVENNGLNNSFLDNFNCSVLYTNNNNLNVDNKGHKELMDVLEVINKFNINDDDFVIKITGRYIIDNNSQFINELKILNDKTDCIIRYGNHDTSSVINRIDDCITGLIGMKAKYIKKIDKTIDGDCIEWKWAKIANTIPDDRIIMLNELGVYIYGFLQPHIVIKK